MLVMDEYCKPLAGAKVYARQHYGLMTRETAVGITDASGGLVVPDLYRGAIYTLRAVLPGYFTWGTKCPAVGGENWIDSIETTMALAGETVKGKVVDASGKPLANVQVTTDFGPAAVTDERGEYTLQQMPAGRVVITAQKGKLQGSNLDPKGRLIAAGEAIVLR